MQQGGSIYLSIYLVCKHQLDCHVQILHRCFTTVSVCSNRIEHVKQEKHYLCLGTSIVERGFDRGSSKIWEEISVCWRGSHMARARVFFIRIIAWWYIIHVQKAWWPWGWLSGHARYRGWCCWFRLYLSGFLVIKIFTGLRKHTTLLRPSYTWICSSVSWKPANRQSSFMQVWECVCTLVVSFFTPRLLGLVAPIFLAPSAEVGFLVPKLLDRALRAGVGLGAVVGLTAGEGAGVVSARSFDCCSAVKESSGLVEGDSSDDFWETLLAAAATLLATSLTRSWR